MRGITWGPSSAGRRPDQWKYLIKREIADRHRVASEEWFGTLAAPFESMPAAGELMAHFAMALEFNDGRIVAQRN